MCCCQLAAAVAHLLPVLNSSCLCFVAPKQGPDSGSKNGATIPKIGSSASKFVAPIWAHGICVLPSAKSALCCDRLHLSFMFSCAWCQDAVFSQYIYIYIDWLCVCIFIYYIYIYMYACSFDLNLFVASCFCLFSVAVFPGFPLFFQTLFPQIWVVSPANPINSERKNHLKSTSFKVCFPLNLKPIDIPLISHWYPINIPINHYKSL